MSRSEKQRVANNTCNVSDVIKYNISIARHKGNVVAIPKPHKPGNYPENYRSGFFVVYKITERLVFGGIIDKIEIIVLREKLQCVHVLAFT